LWLHSVKVAQLLRSAACLHTNQSRSYLNHLVILNGKAIQYSGHYFKPVGEVQCFILAGEGVSPCLVKPFTRDHKENLVGGTMGVVKWRGVGVYLLGTSV